jgi:hypothetical protein
MISSSGCQRWPPDKPAILAGDQECPVLLHHSAGRDRRITGSIPVALSIISAERLVFPVRVCSRKENESDFIGRKRRLTPQRSAQSVPSPCTLKPKPGRRRNSLVRGQPRSRFPAVLNFQVNSFLCRPHFSPPTAVQYSGTCKSPTVLIAGLASRRVLICHNNVDKSGQH